MTNEPISVDLIRAFRRSDDAPAGWTDEEVRASLER